jgi:phosphate transport system permease protein
VSSPSLDLRASKSGGETGFRGLALAAGALVLVILGAIAVVTISKAWPTFRLMGLDFFTTKRWNATDRIYGATAFIFGTIVSSIIALILAVPVSIGIALFTTQIVPAKFRKPVIYAVDLLAVVPSVVFGLWGINVLAPKMDGFYKLLNRTFDGVPLLNKLFGPSAGGKSFFTAGIILALMITPIISSLSREIVDTCPPGEREGALALGDTQWEMIRGVVIPHSKGGLVGAIMLGLGRAMGETIAATLVIGSSPQITANLFGAGNSMPAFIASQWGEADTSTKSALIALAVTLFLITLVVNIVATRTVARSQLRTAGGR